MKTKILHFVHSLNEGGLERLLLEMCKKIDKEKFEIQICCLIEKGSISHFFENEGIRIHLIDAKRDFKIKNFIPNVSALLRICSIIKAEKIDITHGHEFFSTVFSRVSAVLTGVKIRYITLHNVYLWWGPAVHKAQKLLSYFTTKIICNSKATMNYSIKHDKINSDKYILIYNGIDCEKFKPVKISESNPPSGFSHVQEKTICMSVGSISKRKGYEYLIKAAEILKTEFPDLCFYIIGDKHYNEESEFARIQKLIKEKNLADTILITGNRNDVSVILNYCNVYIMPSITEGFGLALAEAMAVQCVCIASDIEPFREIIENGVDGFFFKSKNSESLAQKISDVLRTDKTVLEKISTNARKKIVENFSSERMVREYEKLYDVKNFSK